MRSEMIESTEDIRVEAYRNVRERDLAGRAGLFIAEGLFVVRTLLSDASLYEPASLLIAQRRVEELREDIEKCQCQPPVYVASQQVLNDIAGFDIHRGVLAAGRRRAVSLSVEEIVTACDRAGARTLIAIEGLTNHDNVGGIFRNAAAFGAGGVLLSERCCDPLYRKAIRVSMGAALRVPHGRAERFEDAIGELSKRGWRVMALTPAADAMEINEFVETLENEGENARVAVVLGAEGDGLGVGAQQAADARVRIAMAPGVDSLNVAVASGIALHALCAQRSK